MVPDLSIVLLAAWYLNMQKNL